MMGRQVDLSDMQSKVLTWLQKKMPQAQNLSMSDMQRSGMGLSNETFLFDLSWDEAGQHRSEELVLRSAPQSYPVFPDYDLGKQFHIMDRLAATDVPVPKMYWLEEDATILGTTFYVMGKIDGIVPSDYPSYHTFGSYYDATPEQRAKMWWGSLEAMARLHRIDWRSMDFSFMRVPKGGTDPLDVQLDYYEMYFNWGKDDPEERAPILEASLEWLRKNRYTPEHVSLVWGDARMGNTMYSHSPDFDVLGLFDWEMAYIGDPEADLAWFFLLDFQHSEGAGNPRLEGTPGREESVRRYEEVTGRKVNNLFYNDVWSAYRYGVVLFKIHHNFRKMGIQGGGGEDMGQNNVCTQRLASLLGLPPPGPPPVQRKKIEEITGTVQFHFTGPGGSDWYVVADKGKGTRHEGTVDNPDVTVTATAKDWADIQSGELERIHAWTGGKLKIDGDQALFRQLEDMIAGL